MKVLVIINSLEAGGAEKLIVSTLPLMKNKGLDVVLLLLSGRNSEPSFIKQIENNGIKLVDLKCENIYHVNVVSKIKFQIKSIAPNLIHVHLFPSMYWTAIACLQNSKIPLVFTEHSTQNRRLNSRFFKYLDKFIYSRYKIIICITDAIKEILFQKYKCTNTIVVNNGVDLTAIDNCIKTERSDLFAQLNISDSSSKIILMIARFEYPKRQDLLIEVVKSLPPNYHVLFAGNGSNLYNCEELAKQMQVESRVHFLGFRSDSISLMKSVDLNILLSDYEGLSGVTLESLCSGVPFLGSNVSGISNVVPDSEFLINNQSDIVATRIIETLTNDDLNKMLVAKALDFVTKYSIDNMILDYTKLYQKIIND